MAPDGLAAGVAGILLLATTACGGTPEQRQPRGPLVASPGPTLVVERFLQAANQNDLDTMMALFGTADGPAYERDGVDATEERMFALASLLRHQDYEIAGTRIVPGRTRDATQVVVRMRFGQREVTVPYTLVLNRDGGWMVEQVDVVRITDTQY